MIHLRLCRAVRQSSLIGDDDDIPVELQDRRRDLRRHGAEEAVPDGLRLVRAAGDQQDPLGLHNGLHTHGVRLPA